MYILYQHEGSLTACCSVHVLLQKCGWKKPLEPSNMPWTRLLYVAFQEINIDYYQYDMFDGVSLALIQALRKHHFKMISMQTLSGNKNINGHVRSTKMIQTNVYLQFLPVTALSWVSFIIRKDKDTSMSQTTSKLAMPKLLTNLAFANALNTRAARSASSSD